MNNLPKCELIGHDGNVFNIIGKVASTLSRAGQKDKAKEWSRRAMSAGSYDEVLAMLHEYVEVTGSDEDEDEEEEDDFEGDEDEEDEDEE
jgi:hypothetical protein